MTKGSTLALASPTSINNPTPAETSAQELQTTHANDVNIVEEMEHVTPAAPSAEEIPIAPINDPPEIDEEIELREFLSKTHPRKARILSTENPWDLSTTSIAH